MASSSRLDILFFGSHPADFHAVSEPALTGIEVGIGGEILSGSRF
jgi:hypothetical protein